MKNLLAFLIIVAFPVTALAGWDSPLTGNAVNGTSGTGSSDVTGMTANPGTNAKVLTLTAPGNAMDNLNNSTNNSMNNPTTNSDISGNSTADRNLEKSVQLNLGNNPEFLQSLGGMKISANDGRVTLQGNVRSEAERNSIVEKIEKITGVESVNNQLQVSQ